MLKALMDRMTASPRCPRCDSALLNASPNREASGNYVVMTCAWCGYQKHMDYMQDWWWWSQMNG